MQARDCSDNAVEDADPFAPVFLRANVSALQARFTRPAPRHLAPRFPTVALDTPQDGSEQLQLRPMPARTDPFASFAFCLAGVGGFSEVDGLPPSELPVPPSRSGLVRAPQRTCDLTLKRGLVSRSALVQWIEQQQGKISAPRNLSLSLRDESGKTVMTWTLVRASALKYTSPSLVPPNSADVSLEELVLRCESVNLA
jgi:hypothetical protein